MSSRLRRWQCGTCELSAWSHVVLSECPHCAGYMHLAYTPTDMPGMMAVSKAAMLTPDDISEHAEAGIKQFEEFLRGYDDADQE